MLVAAKTPRIDLRMQGDIPERVLRFLRDEYGDIKVMERDDDDQAVEIRETDWYTDMKTRVTPGDVTRALREMRDLTQEELGEKLGVARQCVSAMERGRRPISRAMAEKLGMALNVPAGRFQGQW